MPALVQVVKNDAQSLVALSKAHPGGARAVERALEETEPKGPAVRTPKTGIQRERELAELDRLMRQRSTGELGSNT